MLILDRSAARSVKKIHEIVVTKVVDSGKDVGFPKVHHRFAVRLLIARGDESVQCKRIVFGRRELFLDEASENARLDIGKSFRHVRIRLLHFDDVSENEHAGLLLRRRAVSQKINSVEILIARTPAEIDAAFERLSKFNCIGCDTETSGLSARYGKLYSIQISDGDLGVLVPLSEGVKLGSLASILSDASIVKVFHNAKFDLEFLGAAGQAVENVFDTMIAEKVLTRGANQSASLAETLYRYFAIDLDKSQRAAFTKRWDGVWTHDLVDYALSDVMYLPALMREQSAWMERLGLREMFSEQMSKITSGGKRDALP